MAKTIKTKKQKKLTDSRRKMTYSLEQEPTILATKSESKPTNIIKTPTKNSITTADYRYLRGDLLRTIFLTGSIAIAELLIKFFTKA